MTRTRVAKARLGFLAFAGFFSAPAFADAPPAASSAAPPPAVAPPVTPAVGAIPVPVPVPVPEKPKPPGAPEYDYDRSRLEPAGFPLIGGNSDIGVEVGAVGTLSKLGHGIRPYEWNMDLVVTVSAKPGPTGGEELTQQNYLWQIDVPGLNGGTLRLNPSVAYVSTINQGYFSLGNASSATRPAMINGIPGRYFEYTDRSALVRELTRVHLVRAFDLMIGTSVRFENPSAYAGSSLALDAAAGRVRGLQQLGLPMLSGGIIYDTRDNEYFPRQGSFHQVGVRAVQAIPFDSDVRYMGFGAIFAVYRPIGGPFVLAARALVDAEFGNVPFYDLYSGEPYNQDQIIGGSAGIRGVPEGRYLGKLKALGNVELRALLVSFHILGQIFELGGDLLFDTGRTWINYTFSSPLDGSGIGLKWGAGGGLYLRWGQAGVFRVEAAYSPDAVSENPTFPIGLYVEDGVMF